MFNLKFYTVTAPHCTNHTRSLTELPADCHRLIIVFFYFSGNNLLSNLLFFLVLAVGLKRTSFFINSVLI